MTEEDQERAVQEILCDSSSQGAILLFLWQIYIYLFDFNDYLF